MNDTNGQSAGKISPWLGGIIDGEGSIMMTSQRMNNGHIKYQPVIQISNTDDAIIAKSIEEISKFTGSFIIEKKTKNFIAKDIKVKGHKRCKTLLPELIPHLYGRKHEKAVLLLEWILYRETQPFNYESTQVDHDYYDKIRRI